MIKSLLMYIVGSNKDFDKKLANVRGNNNYMM